MATDTEIKKGMTFEEVFSLGNEDESTFTSLLTDLVDQIELATTPGIESEINILMEQLVSSNTENEQHLIANALCDKLNHFALAIDASIDKDLENQKISRNELNNLNIAAALIPSETIKSSVLFDAIASSEFKKIINQSV